MWGKLIMQTVRQIVDRPPVEPIKPSMFFSERTYLGTFGFSNLFDKVKNCITDYSNIQLFIREHFSIPENYPIFFAIDKKPKYNGQLEWYYNVFTSEPNINYIKEMAEHQEKLNQYKLDKLKYDLQENIRQKKLLDGEIKKIKSLLKEAESMRAINCLGKQP